MKKLILILGLLVSINSISQSTVGGSPGTSVDSSNNPSGQAFGGAMGGGNTPAASTPALPADSTTSPSVNRDLGVPRGNEFPQAMEENVSPTGNDTRAPSSTVIPPTTSYPADTPVAPAVPRNEVELPRTNGTSLPSGSGVGTGIHSP